MTDELIPALSGSRIRYNMQAKPRCRLLSALGEHASFCHRNKGHAQDFMSQFLKSARTEGGIVAGGLRAGVVAGQQKMVCEVCTGLA